MGCLCREVARINEGADQGSTIGALAPPLNPAGTHVLCALSPCPAPILPSCLHQLPSCCQDLCIHMEAGCGRRWCQGGPQGGADRGNAKRTTRHVRGHEGTPEYTRGGGMRALPSQLHCVQPRPAPPPPPAPCTLHPSVMVRGGTPAPRSRVATGPKGALRNLMMTLIATLIATLIVSFNLP